MHWKEMILMAIELKTLELSDFNTYEKYYKMANYDGYQTNFHSLMLWNNIYQPKFYCNEHFMITLMHYHDFYFWNLPLTTKEYFKEAMDTILEYCDEHQLPFLMDGILEQQEQYLKELFPDSFTFQHSLDNDSYIYDASMHRTLSGKKMQKRRNHYNSFTKTYENRFIYRHVTQDDLPSVLELFDTWKDNKDDDALEYEKNGIIEMFQYLDILNHKMACIEIDGKIEAFIMGSMLNHDTVQIHVEKANNEIRGLYVAIFKLFLENEYPLISHVNREEDLGIESLRKAKQQLHPTKLLYQSFAFRNKPVYFKQANEDDQLKLKQRWLTTFKEDDEAFYDTYLKHSTLHIYYLEIDYQMVSVVYLREMEMNHHKKAYYVEGVSTHSLYLNQGYMKRLLNKVMDLYKDDILFIQAYNWDVYKSFNFDHHIYKQLVNLDTPLPTSKSVMIKDGINKVLFKQLYSHYASNYAIHISRDYPVDLDLMDAIYHEDAYAFYSFFNEKLVVTEIVYKEKEDAYLLLNELMKRHFSIKVICEDDLLQGEKLLFAKYYLPNKDAYDSIYFNEYI